jgi:HSP20 family protein
MKTKSTEISSLKECIEKTRGPIPISCFDLLSKGNIPINMYQTKSNLVIKAFLPGFKPDEIHTSVKKDAISIRGEHRERPEIRESDYFYQEYRHGAFDRKITIPILVQTDKAKTSFKDGVFTMTLPKAGTPNRTTSRAKSRPAGK